MYGNNFFFKRVIMLPREVVEAPSLEVFKNFGGVALRDVVNGHGGGRLGLDWMIVVVSSNLNDCDSLKSSRCCRECLERYLSSDSILGRS